MERLQIRLLRRFTVDIGVHRPCEFFQEAEDLEADCGVSDRPRVESGRLVDAAEYHGGGSRRKRHVSREVDAVRLLWGHRVIRMTEGRRWQLPGRS